MRPWLVRKMATLMVTWYAALTLLMMSGTAVKLCNIHIAFTDDVAVEPSHGAVMTRMEGLLNRALTNTSTTWRMELVPLADLLDPYRLFVREVSPAPSLDVVVVGCDACADVLRVISGISRHPLLLCSGRPRVSSLYPCEMHMLENDVIGQLVGSLHLDEAVLFYDRTTANSIVPYVKALPMKITSLTDQSCLNASDEACGIHAATLTKFHNFIISTDLSISTLILNESKALRILGPEYNWLVDLRPLATEEYERHLADFMQDGDNTAVVTLTPAYKVLQEKMLFQSVNASVFDTLRNAPFSWKLHVEPAFPVLHVKMCRLACSTEADDLTSVAMVTASGSVTNDTDIFPDHFMGFHGRVFKVVTRTWEPFVKSVVGPDGKRTNFTGLCKEILDALAESMNFRYELMEVPDGSFGVKHDDGHWDGMVGMVHRQEVDFAAAGLTINSEREEAVDFTFPYWEEPTTVVLRRPSEETKLLSAVRPLSWSTWLTTFAAIVLASVLVYSATLINVRITGEPDAMTHYGTALWYCLGAFLQQGGFKQPGTSFGRVIAGAWSIVILVIYAIYTGNLIAFLAVQIVNMPFNTLEEMVAQSDYHYGTQDGIIQMMLFKSAQTGVYAQIWEGMTSRAGDIVKDEHEGLAKAMTEKYAFIMEKTVLYANTSSNCNLTFIQQEFFKSGYGFAMKKGWPFKKYFDSAIMHLVEAGFIEHWKSKHWPTDYCGQVLAPTVSAKAVTLNHLTGNYIFSAVGVAVAALTLLVEVSFHRWRHKRNRQVQLTHNEPRDIYDLPPITAHGSRDQNGVSVVTNNLQVAPVTEANIEIHDVMNRSDVMNLSDVMDTSQFGPELEVPSAGIDEKPNGVIVNGILTPKVKHKTPKVKHKTVNLSTPKLRQKISNLEQASQFTGASPMLLRRNDIRFNSQR